jgi:hypothetical protein
MSSLYLFSYVYKYLPVKKRQHSACHHRQYAGCARRRSPGTAVDDTVLLRPLDTVSQRPRRWLRHAHPPARHPPWPGQRARLPTPARPSAPIQERTMLLRLSDSGLWRPRCWLRRLMHGAAARRVVLVHGDGAASPAATTTSTAHRHGQARQREPHEAADGRLLSSRPSRRSWGGKSCTFGWITPLPNPNNCASMNETNFGCVVVHWCSKEEAKKRMYPVACLTAARELLRRHLLWKNRGAHFL